MNGVDGGKGGEAGVSGRELGDGGVVAAGGGKKHVANYVSPCNIRTLWSDLCRGCRRMMEGEKRRRKRRKGKSVGGRENKGFP